MNTLIQQVKQWGHDKGILGKDGKGTLEGQSKKMIEEANETLVAVFQLCAIHDIVKDGNPSPLHIDNLLVQAHEKYFVEAKDGIGDVMVTLILLADMLNLTLEECLQHAYNEIANRQGKMVNGTFIKDK